MKRRLTLLLSLLPLCLMSAVAQIVTTSSPYGMSDGSGVRNTPELPVVRLGAFDRDSAMLALEQQNESELRLLAFAHKQVVDVDIPEAGLHSRQGSTDIWQMRVTSRGAESLSFYFSDFDLPKEGRLYIYSSRDKSIVIGPFGAENNNTRHELATIPIPSDDVIVELQLPTGEEPRLRLREVNHALIKLQDKFGNTLHDLDCAPEVACYPAVSDIARSVVLIYVDGTTAGTGWLTNTSKNDGTPYIMTASHVLSGNFKHHNYEERASRTVVVFNYAVPVCGRGIAPAVTQSLSGAKLVGIDTSTDACMLEMNQRPPSNYRPYYAGWRASNHPVGPYHNIHHPYYQTKRVNRATNIGNDLEGYSPEYPWGNSKIFIMVERWEIGTTESGSSGSPLFDKDNCVVGGLTGGYSFCGNGLSDYFFSLRKVFDSEKEGAISIRKHLTGGDTNLTTCPGREEAGGMTPRSLRITHMPRLTGSKDLRPQIKMLERAELTRHTEVAERYDITPGSKVSGVYVMMDLEPTAQALHASEPLVLRVYDALSSDGREVASAVVPSELLSGTQKFQMMREVFVPLESPLSPSGKGGSYYFALNTSGLPQNVSIVSHQGQTATAFVKEAGSFRSINANLWLDLMVDRDDYVRQDGAEPFVDLKSISDEKLMLTFAKRLQGASGELRIYTLLGQPVYSCPIRLGSAPSGERVLLLDKRPLEGLGVLVLQLRVGGEKENLKIILPTRAKQ